MQTSTALEGIPALLPNNTPHLLGFNWCNTPVYTGTTNKADALNIAMFLKSRPGEIKKFKSPEDISEALNNMKIVYTTITMEDRTQALSFYNRLFNRLLDQFLEHGDSQSVRHLHIDFLVKQLNKLFTKWAGLFKTEQYMHTSIEDFYTVNERTLCFNPVEWIDLYNHNDATQIPRQKEVNP